MTLKEISQRVLISMDQLKFYEANGLLEHGTLADGTVDYGEDVIQRIGRIQTLLKYGMEPEVLKQYFSLDKQKRQQIHLLRKQRYQLLDEIHEKQKVLDELDYMIQTMRKPS